MHELIHLLGIDTQQSWAYDFWSGAGGQLAPAVLAAGWWHRNRCHHPRCPRLARHHGPAAAAGTCRRHARAAR